MLYIYKNFSPNTFSTQHYWYNNLTAFKNSITTYEWKNFAPDKYTINNGSIRVTFSGMTATDANDISYVIDTTTERAYYVDACVYQSGFIIIDVKLDYWATYIHKASFRTFYVKRCNRRLALPVANPTEIRQGFYDSVKSVKTSSKHYIPNEQTPAFATSDIYFVFVANIGIKDSHGDSFDDLLKKVGDLLAGTMSSTTKLYAVPYTTSIPATCEKISNIYDVNVTANLNHPVAVTQCWMIPKYLFKMSATATTFNTYYTGAPSTVTGYEVTIGSKSVNGDLPIDPNYEYYAGTPIKYMKIPRTTEQPNIVWEGIAGQASFQVNVQCGDQVLDISDALEVTLTYNNGSKTGTDIMAHTFKTLTGILNAGSTLTQSITPNVDKKGQVTGFGGGSAIQVAQGTFSSALETCKVIAERPQGSTNSQAEGIASYFTSNGVAQNPLGITTYQSVSNEQAQAETFGVSYECVWPTPDTIKQCSLLHSATATFIQAEVGITGIPTQAIDAIQNMFAGGIILIDNRT